MWPDIRGSQMGDCTTTSPVEDCLQLDVNVPPGSLLPVMVWVTGGSGHYDPTMLVEQQILVVIVRHRCQQYSIKKGKEFFEFFE